VSKIKLVKAEPQHCQFIYDLHRDHLVMKGHGIHDPPEPPFWRNVIMGLYPGWETNFIISRGAAYLGYIGLQDFSKKDRRAQFSITVIPSAWHKGIASAAMNNFLDYVMGPVNEGGMGVECIWAGVFEENIGSFRLLTKLGFQKQGLIPNYYRYGNKRFARVVFAKVK